MLLYCFADEEWRQKRMKNYILSSYQDSWRGLEGVLWHPCSGKQWANQNSCPPVLSCLAPSTVNGKCHCHSTHKASVHCTYSDLATHSQRNGARELIFLSDSYFLTGRSLLMTWNTVQPSQVSTMLSKVLYFIIMLTVSCFEKPYMLWGRAT